MRSTRGDVHGYREWGEHERPRRAARPRRSEPSDLVRANLVRAMTVQTSPTFVKDVPIVANAVSDSLSRRTLYGLRNWAGHQGGGRLCCGEPLPRKLPEGDDLRA